MDIMTAAASQAARQRSRRCRRRLNDVLQLNDLLQQCPAGMKSLNSSVNSHQKKVLNYI